MSSLPRLNEPHHSLSGSGRIRTCWKFTFTLFIDRRRGCSSVLLNSSGGPVPPACHHPRRRSSWPSLRPVAAPQFALATPEAMPQQGGDRLLPLQYQWIGQDSNLLSGDDMGAWQPPTHNARQTCIFFSVQSEPPELSQLWFAGFPLTCLKDMFPCFRSELPVSARPWLPSRVFLQSRVSVTRPPS
jgi:hypothetical protein